MRETQPNFGPGDEVYVAVVVDPETYEVLEGFRGAVLAIDPNGYFRVSNILTGESSLVDAARLRMPKSE